MEIEVDVTIRGTATCPNCGQSFPVEFKEKVPVTIEQEQVEETSDSWSPEED